MEVVSCDRCSKIFTRINRSICKECLTIEITQFEKITEHLKKNKGSDIESIAKITGSSKELINHYISSGKMESEFGNRGLIKHPCSMCGKTISKGAVCKTCDRDLTQNINNLKTKIHDLKNNYGGHKKDNVLINPDKKGI